MAHNLHDTRQQLTLKSGKTATYYSLPKLAETFPNVKRLPISIRIVLESVLRNCDGKKVTEEHIKELASWKPTGARTLEIPFVVARIVLQDFTGVPLLADLAAMRGVAAKLGKNPKVIEPLVPVDLVVDHSVQVDHYGTADSLDLNMKLEFQRNQERYEFMKWGMQAFDTFKVVPPGIGIVHQVNLEYLARGVHDKNGVLYPDSLVGTDSHTTMINGVGVVGWGVGGIEAEAGMLGQPVYFLTPDVVGVNLTGRLPEGTTATDLVLTVTEMLRKAKVVGKFVEFFGEGARALSVPDRATIANMAPEYGATMGFFPVDEATMEYFRAGGRTAEELDKCESYFKAQGMFGVPMSGDCDYSTVLGLDLSTIKTSLAGPKRPQDRIELGNMKSQFTSLFSKPPAENGFSKVAADLTKRFKTADGVDLGSGDVLIAAITSCTNTSNPSVMMAAGLLARNAVKKGLTVKPWVKTSLAPGSQVVTEYLKSSGLQKDLDKLGFALVGYGCTTCIGNSGPLPEYISDAIKKNDVVAAAVLSGNRNFEGRVNPDVRANYLASPPLVVAYALAGSLKVNIAADPLGHDRRGRAVYLKDIWPTAKEVADFVRKNVTRKAFAKRYKDVFKGDANWRRIKITKGMNYAWDAASTYVANPPYFDGLSMTPTPVKDVVNARVLGLFLDSITTDHISPAGDIKAASPAGAYLNGRGVDKIDFNSYGARRGHHEVMMRGTFANIRIKNQMVAGVEGGVTRYYPSTEQMPIYDAAMKYQSTGTPLVIFAGKEYGTGSSRDWAAKGTKLLGVRAVIAQSFERIHRSNLIGMGVVPLQFQEGESWQVFDLRGDETVTISGLSEGLKPHSQLSLEIQRADGSALVVSVQCRIDTLDELDYFMNGGIMPYVLRNLANAA